MPGLRTVDADFFALEALHVLIFVLVLRQRHALASFGDRASVDDEHAAHEGEGERRNDAKRQDVELAHLHGGYSLIEI